MVLSPSSCWSDRMMGGCWYFMVDHTCSSEFFPWKHILELNKQVLEGSLVTSRDLSCLLVGRLSYKPGMCLYSIKVERLKPAQVRPLVQLDWVVIRITQSNPCCVMFSYHIERVYTRNRFFRCQLVIRINKPFLVFVGHQALLLYTFVHASQW